LLSELKNAKFLRELFCFLWVGCDLRGVIATDVFGGDFYSLVKFSGMSFWYSFSWLTLTEVSLACSCSWVLVSCVR